MPPNEPSSGVTTTKYQSCDLTQVLRLGQEKKIYFTYDGHWTKAGHKVVAKGYPHVCLNNSPIAVLLQRESKNIDSNRYPKQPLFQIQNNKSILPTKIMALKNIPHSSRQSNMGMGCQNFCS